MFTGSLRFDGTSILVRKSVCLSLPYTNSSLPGSEEEDEDEDEEEEDEEEEEE